MVRRIGSTPSPRLTNDRNAALSPKLLACSGFRDIGAAILGPIAQELGCRSAYFAQIGPARDSSPCTLERSCFIGPIQQAVERYSAGEFRRDPLLLAQANTIHSMSGMVRSGTSNTPTERAARHSLDRWHEFLLHECQFGDAMGLTLPIETALGSRLVLVTFHRPRDAGPFDETDIDTLRAVYPALRGTLANLVLEETSCLAKQVLAALADAEALGFVLFDEAMNIRHANNSGLACFTSAEALRQQPAGRAARQPVSHQGQLVNLRAATGQTLYLSITRHHRSTRYLDNLKQAYGLTERETEVVRTIAQGHCNSSAAHSLGISVRTIENHLRAIYAKIGIGSRTQLIARALGEADR